jgi:hypothetical protein
MSDTDIKALIVRLRHRWSALTWEAADALEALQAERGELRATLEQRGELLFGQDGD